MKDVVLTIVRSLTKMILVVGFFVLCWMAYDHVQKNNNEKNETKIEVLEKKVDMYKHIVQLIPNEQKEVMSTSLRNNLKSDPNDIKDVLSM